MSSDNRTARKSASALPPRSKVTAMPRRPSRTAAAASAAASALRAGRKEAAVRTVVEGRIVAIAGEDSVWLETADGSRVLCRCPMHVDVGWIKAALSLGPVAAEGSVLDGREEGTIWCLLPTAEQRRVTPEEVTIAASSRMEVVCGKSKLVLSKDGTIRLRGRDVATRGSRITRIQGGVVRVN
jgi:hypothetical protein